MILRFRAEPSQADNLQVRVYTQDRATLLATVASAAVSNPITETIADSGSYECDVGLLTGYWFVTINLVDTGEVTSDGFANQWVPEVLDVLSDSTSTTGTGLYQIAVTIQDDSAANVPGASVTVQNSAGTANIAWGTSDADGGLIVSLDAGDYSVLVRGPTTAYASLAAQSLTVSANASVTYTLTSQSIDPPADPGLATVRFLVLDNSTACQGYLVTATLDGVNNSVDTALLARTVHLGRTGADGICDLTMVQYEAFTDGGVYRVKVTGPQGKVIYDKKVTVPSSSIVYAEDLVEVS